MKSVLAVLLVAASSAVLASGARVVLINGTVTDITVESRRDEVHNDVLPKESKLVLLRQPLWLRFGQEACKYNIGPLEQAARRTSVPLVLQAHSDGRLYLLPKGTTEWQAKPPLQPKGFPLKPTQKVDLT